VFRNASFAISASESPILAAIFEIIPFNLRSSSERAAGCENFLVLESKTKLVFFHAPPFFMPAGRSCSTELACIKSALTAFLVRMTCQPRTRPRADAAQKMLLSASTFANKAWFFGFAQNSLRVRCASVTNVAVPFVLFMAAEVLNTPSAGLLLFIA
jgi:hypothetical protein